VKEGKPSDEELKPSSDPERELLSPLLDDGFELVGTGVARCVLRFPAGSSLSEYAVKLARFGPSPVSFGVNQNRREATLWIDMREVWKAHLVLVDGEPLLADSGLPRGA
jgi:hypothetical protein